MIAQDLKHLKYRLSQDRITVNDKDKEALNNIILFSNDAASKTLERNKLFVKLFIDTFLKLTSIKGESSTGAIKEIERLLVIPVEEYYHKMRKEVPELRFKALSDKLGLIPLYEVKEGLIKVNNDDLTEKHNKAILDKYHKKLAVALTRDYTEKELKDFLDAKLFQLIIKYATYE
jgi:hypothetical protein